jgi:hypothetical protein
MRITVYPNNSAIIWTSAECIKLNKFLDAWDLQEVREGDEDLSLIRHTDKPSAIRDEYNNEVFIPAGTEMEIFYNKYPERCLKCDDYARSNGMCDKHWQEEYRRVPTKMEARQREIDAKLEARIKRGEEILKKKFGEEIIIGGKKLYEKSKKP